MSRVLILGSGGREHALAWKIAQSPKVSQIWVGPGNSGMQLPKTARVALTPCDAVRVVEFAQRHEVDLVIIGPEQPLIAGVADALRASQIACFGPSQAAAQIEGSKHFGKQLMRALQLPTAAWRSTDSRAEAETLLRERSLPCVIKADGLAAGKGSFVIHTLTEGQRCLDGLMVTCSLGNAGKRVIIEEFLEGQECSLHAISDGKRLLPLIAARDYKRRFNDDRGPNTGGMGAYAPFEHPALTPQLTHDLLQPVIDHLAAQGTPFIGALYAGLILGPDGPKVLEFNARFGDPETQTLLPLLNDDLFERLNDAARGALSSRPLRWSTQHAVTVVAVQDTYPQPCSESHPLHLSSSNAPRFFAGVSGTKDALLTSGGRVFSTTGLAVSRPLAARDAYEQLTRVQFNGMAYRDDIGDRE